MFGHPVAVKSRTNREFSTSTGHKGQNAKKAQQGRKLEVIFEYRNAGAFSVSEVTRLICYEFTTIVIYLFHAVLGVG